MINENTTFKQYLRESGYSLMQYQEEVYNACLAKSDKYYNIDLYFTDEIEKGFNENTPVEQVANEICESFDEYFSKNEDDEEYTPEQLQAFADYPQDSFDDDVNESTEAETNDDGLSDGETFNEWKTNVFKYLDKRIETDKIKELGTYIKDFIKQEYDAGEPSWFNVAESVVNYARTNFPQAVKPRESNAFSITENTNEAFMQDDSGNVDLWDLYTAILRKAGFADEEGHIKSDVSNKSYIGSASHYIAAFYGSQSMPKGGMISWGARDLKSFAARLETMEPEEAVAQTRSILMGRPPVELKDPFIEDVKATLRNRRAAEEEQRRQAYLNSEEHRHMNDPGWRGPHGTWSND